MITKGDLSNRMGVIIRAARRIKASHPNRYFNHDNVGVQLDVMQAEITELRQILVNRR